MIWTIASVIAGVVVWLSAGILIGTMLEAFDAWRRERRELERTMRERAIDETPDEPIRQPPPVDPSRIDDDDDPGIEIGRVRRKSNRELRRIQAYRRRRGLEP